MKKIALLVLALFALNSCDVGDDGPNYHLEVLPVESYTVPESFDMYGVYEIKVTYKRPTDCYIYDGIYYEKNQDQRIIGIQTKVLNDNDNCKETIDQPSLETTFNFECTPGNRQYIFKFYKGEDVNGNNVFEEVIVPVTY